MKTVLIVDDDVPLLQCLREGLGHFTQGIDVLLAENGRHAIRLLESQPIDLVLTDLRMPEMDGFQLIAHMARHFPTIPVVVMTAVGTPRIEKDLRERGIRAYLKKPMSVSTTAGELQALLADSPSSARAQLSLITFLPLIEMEHLSCLLIVRSRGREGYFDFSRGILVNAESPGWQGDDAARDMIAWDRPHIEIGDPRTVPVTVHAALDDLLIKRLASLEEEGRNAVEEPVLAQEPPAEKRPAQLHTENIMRAPEQGGAADHRQRRALSILKEDLGEAFISAGISSATGETTSIGGSQLSREMEAGAMEALFEAAGQSGFLLGLGTLRRISLQGPRTTYLLYHDNCDLIRICLNSHKPITGIEQKIEQALEI